jgi:hypothetical protein
MFISYPELVVMLVCASIISIMLVLLFVANHHLLNENRFLRSRLSVWRKRCQRDHVEVPF